MKRTRLQNVIVIALLICLGAGTLSAYVLLSPTRRWASDPNVIVDNRGIPSISDGDLGRTRTRNAIVSTNAWNGAGSGTLLTAAVGSVSGFTLGDGRPMLNFRDPVGACTGNCLAATFTGYFTGSTINDADIVTNYAGFNWASAGEACSSEIYVEGVMVHEVGHLLGLGHSGVAGATMAPTVAFCSNAPATTEADDEAGVNFLY